MNISKQILVTTLVAAFGSLSAVHANGCEVSKKFNLKKAQHLSGVLKDPAGAPLPGFQLDLLKDKKAVLTRTTDDDGVYDLGEVSAGKYEIRLSRSGKPSGFCAPSVKCTAKGCAIESIAKVNQQSMVVM